MWRPLVLVLAVAVLAANLVAGDDPWKDKPYKQWDAKEIQRIMTDSPWSHSVRVPAKWAPKKDMTTPKPAAPPATPTAPLDPTSTGEYDPSRNRTLGGAMSGSVNYPVTSGTDAVYFVVWESSLTVRRASFMLTSTPEERSRQVVTRQLDQYVITVHGTDMTPFRTMDEAALKQSSYLLTKKSNQQLAPFRVEVHGTPDSTPFNFKILKVSFYFSKKTINGEAVIPSDEQQLEFVCDTKLAKFKTGFDLTKMIGPNGADL